MKENEQTDFIEDLREEPGSSPAEGNNQNRERSRRTNRIMIEQTALELFRYHYGVRAGKPVKERLDMIDAALVNHVFSRLAIRAHQDKICHNGTSFVWVHYPTVREENWLLESLGDRALRSRFAKLVRFGILVAYRKAKRTKGQYKGSKAYFALSEAFRERLEEVETTPSSQTTTEEATATDRNESSSRLRSTDRNENSCQSLCVSRVPVKLEVDGSARASPSLAPSSKPEPEEGRERGLEQQREKLHQQAVMLGVYGDDADEPRASPPGRDGGTRSGYANADTV